MRSKNIQNVLVALLPVSFIHLCIAQIKWIIARCLRLKVIFGSSEKLIFQVGDNLEENSYHMANIENLIFFKN